MEHHSMACMRVPLALYMYLDEKHREQIADLELRYHISTILSNVFNPDPYVCNVVHLILCPFHKMFCVPLQYAILFCRLLGFFLSFFM